MVVAASCCGHVFQWQGLGGLVRVERKLNGAEYSDILRKTWSRMLRTSDRAIGSPSNMKMTHTVNTMQEWFWNSSVNVLE